MLHFIFGIIPKEVCVSFFIYLFFNFGVFFGKANFSTCLVDMMQGIGIMDCILQAHTHLRSAAVMATRNLKARAITAGVTAC